MRLTVYAAGKGAGKGTHVSVYLSVMNGIYDDELEESGYWPLRGTFTIELLNQLNNSDHYSRILQFHHYRCSKCTKRVLAGFGDTTNGWGYSRFISHDTLLHHSNNSYYKSDCLIFRIANEYTGSETPYQVAPVRFVLTEFSHWLKSKADWYSSSFFAFKKGYQFYLKVNVAGDEGTHVSVYLYLLKGPHDKELEQLQLRGMFTIELLECHGFFGCRDHHSSTVKFDATRSVNKQYVHDSVMIEAIDKYISHTILFQYAKDYLRSDALVFKISYREYTVKILKETS